MSVYFEGWISPDTMGALSLRRRRTAITGRRLRNKTRASFDVESFTVAESRWRARIGRAATSELDVSLVGSVSLYGAGRARRYTRAFADRGRCGWPR